jgi:hypothetical protein
MHDAHGTAGPPPLHNAWFELVAQFVVPAYLCHNGASGRFHMYAYYRGGSLERGICVPIITVCLLTIKFIADF